MTRGKTRSTSSGWIRLNKALRTDPSGRHAGEGNRKQVGQAGRRIGTAHGHHRTEQRTAGDPIAELMSHRQHVWSSPGQPGQAVGSTIRRPRAGSRKAGLRWP